MDPGGILNDMKDTASQYKVIKKKVEQETADKARVFISDNDIKGVFLEPTSKRYYPYSSGSPRTSSALSTPTAAPTALRPCMTRN